MFDRLTSCEYCFELVGNKCDMTDKRQVPTERAQQLAIEHRITFMETSAKDDVNVSQAFMSLTHGILSKQQQRQPVEVGTDGPIRPGQNEVDNRSYFQKCCSK